MLPQDPGSRPPSLLPQTQELGLPAPPPSDLGVQVHIFSRVLDPLNSGYLKALAPYLGHQSSMDTVQMNTSLRSCLRPAGESRAGRVQRVACSSVLRPQSVSFLCSVGRQLSHEAEIDKQPSLLLPCEPGELTPTSENRPE